VWQRRRARDILFGVTKPVPGTLQEGGASFQTTHWTVVLNARQSESPESAEKALSVFSEIYWPPLYTFVRHRGYKPADAQDLVQGFFIHLFEKNTLSRADQEKGRLRTFLLGALQKFLMDERDKVRAIKRGGGRQIVSFDEHMPEVEAAMFATAHLDDANAYDATWASNVVTRAWQRLRDEFAAEGKSEWLDQLRPFVEGGTTTPRPRHEEVANRLGVPVGTVRTRLSRLRQRYRNTLRAEVASTVSASTDVDDELRYLYQILTS
jgi:DNA-directed RNA polymerase specialized sigma24 family protein